MKSKKVVIRNLNGQVQKYLKTYQYVSEKQPDQLDMRVIYAVKIQSIRHILGNRNAIKNHDRRLSFEDEIEFLQKKSRSRKISKEQRQEAKNQLSLLSQNPPNRFDIENILRKDID